MKVQDPDMEKSKKESQKLSAISYIKSEQLNKDESIRLLKNIKGKNFTKEQWQKLSGKTENLN